MIKIPVKTNGNMLNAIRFELLHRIYRRAANSRYSLFNYGIVAYNKDPSMKELLKRFNHNIIFDYQPTLVLSVNTDIKIEDIRNRLKDFKREIKIDSFRFIKKSYDKWVLTEERYLKK
jgi:hypothetical protein